MLICGDNEILAVGANIVSNPNFTTFPDTSWIWGTGWTHDTTHADHTAGIAALEQDVGAIAGTYTITFTMSNRTTGSVTPYIGGIAGTGCSTNATHAVTITAVGTGNLQFVPSTGFDGTIDTVYVENFSHGFTAAKILPVTGNYKGRKCQKVFFQVLTSIVYVSFYDTIATTTKGIHLVAGDYLTETGYDNIKNIRFTRDTLAASVRAWFWYQV